MSTFNFICQGNSLSKEIGDKFFPLFLKSKFWVIFLTSHLNMGTHLVIGDHFDFEMFLRKFDTLGPRFTKVLQKRSEVFLKNYHYNPFITHVLQTTKTWLKLLMTLFINVQDKTIKSFLKTKSMVIGTHFPNIFVCNNI